MRYENGGCSLTSHKHQQYALILPTYRIINQILNETHRVQEIIYIYIVLWYRCVRAESVSIVFTDWTFQVRRTTFPDKDINISYIDISKSDKTHTN